MSRKAAGGWYSRLGVRRLVALERVAQVVFVVHVTLGAQVIVEAHFAFPAHPHDAVLLTAVTDDVGVAHACRRESGGEENHRYWLSTSLWQLSKLKKLLIEGSTQPLLFSKLTG